MLWSDIHTHELSNIERLFIPCHLNWNWNWNTSLRTFMKKFGREEEVWPWGRIRAVRKKLGLWGTMWYNKPIKDHLCLWGRMRCLELCGYSAVTCLGHRVPSFPPQELHLTKFNHLNIITRQVSSNIVQNSKYTSWCRSGICSGRNRQGSTSVTSYEYRNNPCNARVAISTSYMAVLPPVLNIYPVSCTLETKVVGENRLTLKEKPMDAG